MSGNPFFKYKPRRAKLDLDDTINGKPLLDLITQIASYRHTKGEAAALLGVGYSTFNRFLDENPEAKEAWKDGRQICKASVRRLLFVHAKSDPSTARYLANNLLADMTKDGVDATADAAGGVDRLSRDDAKKRILELQAITSSPPQSKGRALITQPQP